MAKLLVFADSHSNLASIKALRDFALKEKPEIIISLGDLTNEGLKDIAVEAFDILSECKARLFFIPGNQDTKEITEFFESRQASLQKKSIDLNEITLIGLGGGKPVNVIYHGTNLGELEAKKVLKELFEENKGKKIILFSHAPPSGLKLSRSFKGIELGVNALSKAIIDFKPLLSVSGHVHESKGVEELNGIECINIGPLRDGYCLLIIEKEGKLKWQRKKIF